MTDVRISKEEYTEFLKYKKEKLLKQIEEIDALLSNTTADKHSLIEPAHSSNGGGHAETLITPFKVKPKPNVKTGWKFILDDLLRERPDQSVLELVSATFAQHKLNMDREAVRKTIWSTLSSNSKGDKKRYECILRNGEKLWRLHSDFKE